jgi:acetyl esterase/lipase
MPYDPPRPGRVETDITYCTPGGLPQKLDLYFPPESIEQPWPVVVYIHGGSWQEGDKKTALYMPVFTDLQAGGFLIAAINYRLAPEHTFPAQIEDARCAIRFLRVHAIEYNLDPLKIGVIGDSAGGHLAALLGLTDANPQWNNGEYADQSTAVQAIVDLYGISDLSRIYEINGNPIWTTVFKVTQKSDPLLAAASPLTYASADAPPFLLIHGSLDRLVPFEQSQWLADALESAGNSVELIEVQNADHGFISVGGAPIQPDYTEINKKIADFFIKNL